MQIIGQGMVARSLQPYAQEFPDVVAFAGGVANSTLTDAAAYDREHSLLRDQLEQCRQNDNRLIYFSSGGAIYGSNTQIRDERTPTYPVTHYGKHKLACETLIRESGTRYLIVRLANLVGNGQNSAQLIPVLIQQIKSGHLNLQAYATRDILDVDDFASILAKLLRIVPDNELIILASGISVPVSQLVNSIQETLGLSATIEAANIGEPQQFSISKLRTFLPEISFSADYYQAVIHKYLAVNVQS
jgi:nucleoside-diphosphate-sugar epimerase